MRQVILNQLWTASVEEVEELASPEAMGRYAAFGIRGILTVTHGDRPRIVAVLPQLCLPVEETIPTPHPFFVLACRFARAFSPLVVHCHAGVNRSRVFAAAIAFQAWGMELDDAIRAADPPAGLCRDSFHAWAQRMEKGP